jgi:enoyl-CoA hydratase
MIKWMLNDVARHQYQPATSRLLGFIFDGVARHTQEGLDFEARAREVGWRQVVRERDRPFGDYGERGPSGPGSAGSAGHEPPSQAG